MPRYFFQASAGDRVVEDESGSHFADDEMAIAEIMATGRACSGQEPTKLIVKDDTGRVVTPKT